MTSAPTTDLEPPLKRQRTQLKPAVPAVPAKTGKQVTFLPEKDGMIRTHYVQSYKKWNLKQFAKVFEGLSWFHGDQSDEREEDEAQRGESEYNL